MKIPKSVKEAVDTLTSLLTVEAIETLKKTDEEELISYHHTLGRTIRNEFGLWNKNDILLKNCLKVQKSKYKDDYLYCQKHYKLMLSRSIVAKPSKKETIHADDASFVIVKELWNKVRK